MPALPDALSVFIRAISFVLILQAAGVALFVSLFGRYLSDSSSAVQRLGRASALWGIVCLCIYQLLQGARMSGDMSGIADPSMQAIALESGAGITFGLRLIAMALLAVRLRGVPDTTFQLLGALIAVASFCFTGHTLTTAHRMPAAIALVVHLLLVAFWLGALRPLGHACTRESAGTAAKVIAAFSGLAVALVPIILLAGMSLAFLLIPDWGVFSRPYGQLLLAKVGLFAVLLVLASANKWRYAPRIGSGDGTAIRAFQRTVAVEYVLICAVLAVTAVMTMFYSPEAA